MKKQLLFLLILSQTNKATFLNNPKMAKITKIDLYDNNKLHNFILSADKHNLKEYLKQCTTQEIIQKNESGHTPLTLILHHIKHYNQVKNKKLFRLYIEMAKLILKEKESKILNHPLLLKFLYDQNIPNSLKKQILN